MKIRKYLPVVKKKRLIQLLKIHKKLVGFGLILILIFLILLTMFYRNRDITDINPVAYQPLLATIAKGESNDNYNAYFGNSTNTELRFTDMTVTEVIKWQDDHIMQGNFSSAVGKYQIIRPTLNGLILEFNIPPNTKFDENLQDLLAIHLIERRGALKFVNQKLTREQFAYELSKEWAALPRTTGLNPNDSYYAGDGINKSRISVDEITSALYSLEKEVILNDK